MTLGGAAQVVSAHCPNERTLYPTVRSPEIYCYCSEAGWIAGAVPAFTLVDIQRLSAGERMYKRTSRLCGE